MTGNINRKNLKSGHFHLVTTGCIGIVLAVILFFTVRGREQRQIMANFEHDVEIHISSLREQINGNIHELDVLQAFYEGSHNVERNEFRTFVKHTLSHVPSIQALEWIPRLPDSRRLEYEDKARKDGFPDFRITERDINGKLVKASRREEYFPVYFVEPYKGNESALGFDLASNALLLNALNQSRGNGKIVATNRIKLVQENGPHYGFLLFLPIFDQVESADTAGLRQKNLKGFVLGVFRIDAIVEAAFQYLETKGIDVYLFNRSAPGGEQFLYHHSTGTNSRFGTLNNVNLAEIRTGNFIETTLNVGGKKWLMLSRITEGYSSIQDTWKHWVAAIIVLIITVLIFLMQNRHKKEREYSTKILEANNILKSEIEERRKIEENLQNRTHDLGERVKELNCLYGITALVEKPGISLEEILQGSVDIIPPAWQYPEITCGKITVDGQDFTTEHFRETEWKQTAEITVDGNRIGNVEVVYLEKRPESREGPFLKEERDLVNAIAQYLGRYMERRQTEKLLLEEKRQMQETQNKLEGAYEELVQTQSKMLHQEKMASVGQLAAGVAHEINNPIGFITSNLGTLSTHTGALAEFINELTGTIDQLNGEHSSGNLKERRKQLDIDYILDDIEPLIRESLDGTERVKRIVQNLKSFSRVDESEYKFADINECIESTLNIVWNELKYKATVEKEYGYVPPTKCYPQQLNQVFMNILVNAAQAIEKKGIIRIRTWNNDGFINVSISDTGHGIAEKDLSSIFDPFFTTKEVGKGTGLGLSICYEIIENHKGEITADSELGKGTSFTIKIPLVEESENG